MSQFVGSVQATRLSLSTFAIPCRGRRRIHAMVSSGDDITLSPLLLLSARQKLNFKRLFFLRKRL